MFLYTSKGELIRNMIDAPDVIDYLLVSEKGVFKDLTNEEIVVDTNL